MAISQSRFAFQPRSLSPQRNRVSPALRKNFRQSLRVGNRLRLRVRILAFRASVSFWTFGIPAGTQASV